MKTFAIVLVAGIALTTTLAQTPNRSDEARRADARIRMAVEAVIQSERERRDPSGLESTERRQFHEERRRAELIAWLLTRPTIQFDPAGMDDLSAFGYTGRLPARREEIEYAFGSPGFDPEAAARKSFQPDPNVEKEKAKYYEDRGVAYEKDVEGRVVPQGTRRLGSGVADYGDLAEREVEISSMPTLTQRRELAMLKALEGMAAPRAENDASHARPATSNSGGVMVRGGKAVIVPGAAFPSASKDSLSSPMHGFQWVFPSRPDDHRVIRRDSIGLKDEERAKMDAESRAKTIARYPFLADKSDERVKKLNAYIKVTYDNPDYVTVYCSAQWREIIVEEFAALSKWEPVSSAAPRDAPR